MDAVAGRTVRKIVGRRRVGRESRTDLARIGLLVLFPGYVVYHYAVAVGLTPAFAGGLFGGASAFFAAVGLCSLAWRAAGGLNKEPVWVDLVSGRIYELPSDRIVQAGDFTIFRDVPLYDSPVLIVEKALVLR